MSAPTPPGNWQQPGPPPPMGSAPHGAMAGGPTPGPPPGPALGQGSDLIDGEWHRLHPLTPLLRVGVFVIAIGAFLINQSWQTITSFLFPQLDEYSGAEYDPTNMVLRNEGWLLWVALGILAVILILGFFSYLSWRFSQFRVSDTTIELQTGVLFRKSRQARLDRVQDINIQRPLVARIVGASKIEIGVAGENANIQLVYVRTRDADGIRAGILQRASGAKRNERQAQAHGYAHAGQPGAPGSADGSPSAPGYGPAGASGDSASQPQQKPPTAEQLRTRASEFFAQRVEELTSPELAPGEAAPQSVVRLPPWRLVVANLVNPWLIVILVALIAGLIVTFTFGFWWLLFSILPLGAVFFAVTVGQILPSLNYSIAATPDGVRVGRGLLTTSNDTVPPGRIHAVQVSQPLFWRPFDWWMVRITRAGTEQVSSDGSQNQAALTRNLVLPVGTRAETERVLALLLPMLVDDEVRRLIELGMYSKGNDDYFVTAPKRAAWMRPFSWKRHGFRLDNRALYLRFGAWSRKLTIVPAERMQSIGLDRGPIGYFANVVNLHAHTVLGLGVTTRIGMVDGNIGVRLFDDVSAVAIRAANLDTSHRWREAATLSAIATARMRVADAAARGIPVDSQTTAVLQAEREYQHALAQSGLQETTTPPVAQPQAAQNAAPAPDLSRIPAQFGSVGSAPGGAAARFGSPTNPSTDAPAPSASASAPPAPASAPSQIGPVPDAPTNGAWAPVSWEPVATTPAAPESAIDTTPTPIQTPATIGPAPAGTAPRIPSAPRIQSPPPGPAPSTAPESASPAPSGPPVEEAPKPVDSAPSEPAGDEAPQPLTRRQLREQRQNGIVPPPSPEPHPGQPSEDGA
ncbi:MULTISPECIES: PH domain-containing protein [unclassified Pseudoclavibacter]|uniref:PH domain-containing protein n=1 Tax=unclassified Pseudoclavibacter TaxID=2615177 RepID=UPI001BAA7201|nr:PH domain-containing protein [Pseudoclavibacter sp. Marseille-Q4354]MBS3180165.1 PH domain-containing protein [Pseudoclavibacter sp. Marseille-Q4354]